MSEGTLRSSTEEIMSLLRKVEVRLEKARNEAARLRWYKRLNPARRKRLNRYDARLNRARRLWRDGDSASTVASLRALDLNYPSVLGLIYGTYRKNERSKEVYELEEEHILKLVDLPPGGFHGGGAA